MKKIYILIIVLLVLVVFRVSSTQTSAQDIEQKLGDLIYYNAIIRNDFTADQADIEGSLAVGGNMYAPALEGFSYSVGASYPGAFGQHVGQVFDATNGPALLLGGYHSMSGTGMHVLGDYTTFSGNSNQGIDVLGSRYIMEKTEIIDHIESMVERADLYLNRALSYRIDAGMQINGGNGWNSSKISFYQAVEDAGINIGLIDGSNIGEIYLPSNVINQDATILVSYAKTIDYLPGGTLIFNGVQIDVNQLYEENSTMSKIASKIIYFFPEATVVNLDHQGVIGSVYAPKAKLIANGGSINGQAIFDSANVKGGFEFHNYRFMWRREFATGELEVIKMDTETHDFLEKAEFGIYDLLDDSLIMTGITDNQGKLYLQNIPYGKYILREINPPVGYQCDFEDVYFEIHAQQQTVVFRAYNTKKRDLLGSLSVLKVDDETQEKLVGALFELYRYEDNVLVESVRTNENGIAVFSNLPFGTYRLVESEPPIGYTLPFSRIMFVRIVGENQQQVTVKNNKIKEGELVLHKTNVLDEPLVGATFTFWNSNDEIIAIETTDLEGVIRLQNLPIGIYTYKETIAPEGYQIDETVYSFEITQELLLIEKVRVNYLEDEMPINMDDGQVRIRKVDSQNMHKELEGTSFKLINTDSGVSYTLVTEIDGIARMSNLPYGPYQITEEVAPPGYTLSSDIVSFFIGPGSKRHVFTFTNAKIELNTGGIHVIKYDGDTNEKLEGVQFKLINIETNEEFYATTNDHGEVLFSGLVTGTYTLEEHYTIEGYVLNTNKIVIELTENNSYHFIPFYNYRVENNNKKLTVMKVDQYDRSVALEGAVYRIESEKGIELSRSTTNLNGVIVFENIPSTINKVFLIEEMAPTGYEISNEIVEVDLNILGINSYYIQATNLKRTGDILISKALISEIYGQSYDLSKIYFRLTDKASKQILFRLNENGERLLTLEPGIYTLSEISVPDNMVLSERTIEFEVFEYLQQNIVIRNNVVDSKISIWLIKEDNEGNPLEGIPFELFVVDLEGNHISMGISITQGDTELDTKGIAVWDCLTVSMLFDSDGTQKFQEIYVVEIETEEEITVVQDLLTKYPVKLTIENTLEHFIQIINDNHENGAIINKRIDSIDLEKKPDLPVTGLANKENYIFVTLLIIGILMIVLEIKRTCIGSKFNK